MVQYLPSPAAKVVLDSVSSMSPCIVMKDDGYSNIRHTYPIWVRAIMSSPPKWKNHCEGHVTTQKRWLFMLQSRHCWTSTEVDALMAYDSFHVYGKRWCTWRFSRRWLWRMPSSVMLRRVALVRTNVSEELSSSIIWVPTRAIQRNHPRRRHYLNVNVFPTGNNITSEL
jgi:hypothetical protein